MKRWEKYFVIIVIVLALLFIALFLYSCVRSLTSAAGRKESYSPAVSGNGRYVAFASYDPELREDVNAACSDRLCWQIYVRDMETGELAVASEPARTPGAAGVDAYGFPYGGGTLSLFGKGPTSTSISDDGRFVVFSSSALDPGDEEEILYRKDMLSGELSPVSPLPSQSQRKATFFFSSMSGDGRFIAYWKYSPADSQAGRGAELYVRDMMAAAPEAVSLDANPVGASVMPTEPESTSVDISADGRFIAFAARPDRADAPVKPGVFIKDRLTGEIRTISSSSTGESGNASSSGASISGDGRLAVFASRASNLVPEPTCKQLTSSCTNVYLKDLQSGETRLLSKTESGAVMNNAGSPVISEDGSSAAFVVLTATAPTEKTKPTTSSPAVMETIYLSDLGSGHAVAVTPKPDGSEGSDNPVSSVPPSFTMSFPQELLLSRGVAGAQGMGISANGRFIAFPSISNWLGWEDRMCGFRISGKRDMPDWLDTSPPDPCLEIFYKDVITGDLSRVSASSQ
ncbi:MAG: TolB family protein [Thermoleophilia bacterium]